MELNIKGFVCLKIQLSLKLSIYEERLLKVQAFGTGY